MASSRLKDYLLEHSLASTLHTAMLCPLYSNNAKKSMKSISAIYPAITENTQDILVKRVPHISTRESHNALISTMLNLFYYIMSKEYCEKSLSDFFALH